MTGYISGSQPLQPFSTVPHVVVNPNHKIILLLHHNHNFDTVTNQRTHRLRTAGQGGPQSIQRSETLNVQFKHWPDTTLGENALLKRVTVFRNTLLRRNLSTILCKQ